MTAELLAALPERLRTPATQVARIAQGLSGAGVYRVDADGRAYVLKIGSAQDPLPRFRHKIALQRGAATAGIAPELVHVDEDRRAVVTAFVQDRGLPPLLMNPATREAGIALLAQTLRKLHALPIPEGSRRQDLRAWVLEQWSQHTDFPVPVFAREAIDRGLRAPLRTDGPTTVVHHDLNPSNLAYDGERILVLDWDTAGSGDPLDDVATLAVFLRFDEATCTRLLSLTGLEVTPDALHASMRFIAAAVGSMFVGMARRGGHPGDAALTADAALDLGSVYDRMRTGALSPATPEGQWLFGLALAKASAAR